MNNSLKDKGCNQYAAIAALFLSFGFSGFYSARGTLASYSAAGVFVFNDIWAIALAAISGGLVYELVTMLLFRRAPRALGERSSDCRNALRLFYIPANLCSGALKLLYFVYPFLMPYGEIFIDFIFALVFFAAFIAFCFKYYIRPELRARALMYMGSSFLGVYGLLAALSFVSEAVA